MDTMYRCRTAGRGSRTARKKRGGGLPARERRRLLQLGASVILFLAVFFGRGVLPEQAEVWKSVLGADMDLRGAVTAFGETVSEGGDVLEVLDVLWAGATEPQVSEEESPQESGTELLLPVLTTPAQRALAPSFGALPALGRQAVVPEGEVEPEPEPEEAVVTAVAQLYDEGGEALPENVSFQHYYLGLYETAMPVIGEMTSDFGFRDHPVSGEYSFHTAVDIGVENGTDVLAFSSGTVRYIGENDVFGLYLKIDHDNGVATFYAHCEELLVQAGDTVECGQVVAKSGETGNATGPHLHFSIEKDGVRLDPAYYLDLS